MNPSSTKADSGHLTSDATKTVHSPLPWVCVDDEREEFNGYVDALYLSGFNIHAADGSTVVGTEGIGPEEIDAENAALIVRAVNSHAELVGTLRSLIDAIDRYEDAEVRAWVKETCRVALSRATEGDAK